MKRIINPWTQTPGYNCFGCSPDNPIGTRMRFFEDGDDIVSIWRPTQNHQSWLNTLHGGIQAVLLDEVCGWVVFHKLQTVNRFLRGRIISNCVRTSKRCVVMWRLCKASCTRRKGNCYASVRVPISLSRRTKPKRIWAMCPLK